VDKSVCLWDLRGAEGTLVQRISGAPEPVRAAAVQGSDLLCAVGSKIGLSALIKARSTQHAARAILSPSCSIHILSLSAMLQSMSPDVRVLFLLL
jgi:hypothetical protein